MPGCVFPLGLLPSLFRFQLFLTENSSDDECHDSEVALTQRFLNFLVRGLLP
jgi:hypothetical protein